MPIPGASSALAALAWPATRPSTGFAFVGFLPARGSERARALGALAAARRRRRCCSRRRIASSALAAALGRGLPASARVTLCRELTKQFETIATLPARALPAWLAADPNRGRGEFVLVLHALATTDAARRRRRHDAVLRRCSPRCR